MLKHWCGTYALSNSPLDGNVRTVYICLLVSDGAYVVIQSGMEFSRDLGPDLLIGGPVPHGRVLPLKGRHVKCGKKNLMSSRMLWVTLIGSSNGAPSREGCAVIARTTKAIKE